MRDTKRFYFTSTPATGIHPYSQHPVGPWGTPSGFTSPLPQLQVSTGIHPYSQHPAGRRGIPNSFTSPLPQLQVSTGIHPYSQHPMGRWGTQQCQRDPQRQTRACCWWCWTPLTRMPWCLGVLRLAQLTRWTLTWLEPPAALASELSPQPLWRRQANTAGVTISSLISYLCYAKINRFFFFFPQEFQDNFPEDSQQPQMLVDKSLSDSYLCYAKINGFFFPQEFQVSFPEDSQQP